MGKLSKEAGVEGPPEGALGVSAARVVTKHCTAVRPPAGCPTREKAQ